MNKKIFTYLMVGITVCVVYASCSKDDSGNSGAPGSPAGTMVGDEEEANALLEGIRLSSAGSYRYQYDDNGILASMDYNNWSGKVETGKITWGHTYEDKVNSVSESYTLNVSSNHIVSMSMNESGYYSDSWGESSWTRHGNASFSYNAKGQLSSISISYSENGSEAEERYSESGNGTITFNYSSDYRLLSMKEVFNYIEDGERSTLTSNITCNYSSEPTKNPFYQYTPHMLNNVLEELEGFMYVGLLGRASSCIPSSYAVVWEEKYDDGESDSGSYTSSSNVSFNSNGTIRSADGISYSYISVGTRFILPDVELKQDTINQNVKCHRHFIHRMHVRYKTNK